MTATIPATTTTEHPVGCDCQPCAIEAHDLIVGMATGTVTPITGRVPKGSTDTALHRAHAARPARMTASAPQVDPERTAAMERVHDALRAQLDARHLYAVRLEAYPVGGVIVVTGLAAHDVTLRFTDPGTVDVTQRTQGDWVCVANATLTRTPASTIATVALALI